MTDPMDTFREIHADSFLRAYERCINPADQGLGTPALICAALAAELGLKLLLVRSGIEKNGHDLKALLAALPAAESAAIVERLQEQFPDWPGQLDRASKAFVDWRYVYESEGPREVNIYFVGALASAVNARVRAARGAT
jgi:hypothetical protein